MKVKLDPPVVKKGRRPPRPKHKPDATAFIERRRAEVSRLRLRGLTIHEIALALAELGFVNHESGKPWTDATIFSDIEHCCREWHERAAADTARHRARILAELEQVKRACWSKADYKNLLGAIKQERELLGVDAPIKIASVTPDGAPLPPLHVHLQSLSVNELRLIERVFADAHRSQANHQDAIEAVVTG